MVVAITVVYSVPDDHAAVTELGRVLRPGGVLLLVEPAFPSLRRAHDKTVGGVRRYRRAGLADLATEAGLTVQRATYAYSFLVPPSAALSIVDRLHPRPVSDSGSDVERRALDRVFRPLARLERRRLRHGDVPFGTSTIVVATRGPSDA